MGGRGVRLTSPPSAIFLVKIHLCSNATPPTSYVALGGRIDVQHRVFCHKAAADSAQPLRVSSSSSPSSSTGQLLRNQPRRHNSIVGINSRVWQLQYNLCCCVTRPIALAIRLLVQFRILHITERYKTNNTELYLNLRLIDFRISGFTIHI
jgi:hypothetical protein